MDAARLWGQVKEEYELLFKKNRPAYFDNIVAIAFSETSSTLTIQAKDASEALCLNVEYGPPLITALENVIGAPAFIRCIYNPTTPKQNPRFTMHRADDDAVAGAFLPTPATKKSALEMVLEDIGELKKRMSTLEAKN